LLVGRNWHVAEGILLYSHDCMAHGVSRLTDGASLCRTSTFGSMAETCTGGLATIGRFMYPSIELIQLTRRRHRGFVKKVRKKRRKHRKSVVVRPRRTSLNHRPVNLRQIPDSAGDWSRSWSQHRALRDGHR
jgi:hypothetical protein